MFTVVNPIAAEQVKLIVFDLDGTLIDSSGDLAAAVNAMLIEMGRTTLSDAAVAEYVGNGARMLVQRALGEPDDEALVDDGVERFLACYRAHMLDRTHVYDGVFPALDALRVAEDGSRRKFAVLTNKPVNPARTICEALKLRPYFFEIFGGNSFAVKKPEPEGLNTLMRLAGARPEETLMVGDSIVDVRTARNAGASVIGCRFGLSSHTLKAAASDCMVDAPSEWPLALAATART